jgi:nitroreductase
MISLDDFRKLCDQRRSIRYFSDEPVNTDDIKTLIEVAQLAPSVENTQPWHFHIITNPDLRAQLMETSCYGNFVAGAGTFIIVTCDRTAKPKTQEIIWNPKELEYSCAVAMNHLILAATAAGLGSCWVSLHHGQAHDILKLKANLSIIDGIMIGHLKPGEEKAGAGHQRKQLEDIYTIYE